MWADLFKSIALNVLSLFMVDFGDANGMKYTVLRKSSKSRLLNSFTLAI